VESATRKNNIAIVIVLRVGIPHQTEQRSGGHRPPPLGEAAPVVAQPAPVEDYRHRRIDEPDRSVPLQVPEPVGLVVLNPLPKNVQKLVVGSFVSGLRKHPTVEIPFGDHVIGEVEDNLRGGEIARVEDSVRHDMLQDAGRTIPPAMMVLRLPDSMGSPQSKEI